MNTVTTAVIALSATGPTIIVHVVGAAVGMLGVSVC